MKIVVRTAALLAICVLAISSVAAQKKAAAKPFYTVGYYNGIEMTSKESGDYGGISIYLAQSANDTFALVTTAEGTIFDPVLVKAKMSGKDMRTIEFALPGDNGEKKFKGTVTATGLSINWYDAKKTLKRQCSRTFSDIAVSRESGDAGGMEIYITDSAGSWFALVSMAEGEVGEPVLVPAEVTGKNYDKIAFTLDDRKITGTIGKTALTLNDGGTKLVLRSKCYK